jgi:hypothetical protein
MLPNAALKVKAFKSDSLEDLEKQINEFMIAEDGGEIISLQYATIPNIQCCYTALSLYIKDSYEVTAEAAKETEEYPSGKTNDFDD